MWRCSQCHSTAVQGYGWVDLNSPTVSEDEVDDLERFWCESCSSDTEVYFKTEPEEPQSEDDDFDFGLPDD